MSDVVRHIDTDEKQLNNLFKEVLDGLRDDLTEAQLNVDMYHELVTKSDDQKMAFGGHYNDSLKIKGSARDRQLKFLNTFKDRVTKKETIELTKEIKALEKAGKEGGGGIDHAEMNRLIEEFKNKQKTGEIGNIELDLNEEEDDDE